MHAAEENANAALVVIDFNCHRRSRNVNMCTCWAGNMYAQKGCTPRPAGVEGAPGEGRPGAAQRYLRAPLHLQHGPLCSLQRRVLQALPAVQPAIPCVRPGGGWVQEWIVLVGLSFHKQTRIMHGASMLVGSRHQGRCHSMYALILLVAACCCHL